jgi:hypothetical protein
MQYVVVLGYYMGAVNVLGYQNQRFSKKIRKRYAKLKDYTTVLSL